jgi:CRISPR-associated protein Csm2
MSDNRNYPGRNHGKFNNYQSSNYHNEPKTELAPVIKIEKFYKEDGKPKTELFGKFAEDIAKNFVGISRTQLRRIFDEVKRYEEIITQENFNDHYPYIVMIKSKTRYAVARATNNKIEGAYKNLYDFIYEGISLIETKEDYHVFLALFEAVYGFCYEKLRK